MNGGEEGGRRAAVGGRLAVGSGGLVGAPPILLLGRESGNQGRRNRTTGRRRGRLGDKERV